MTMYSALPTRDRVTIRAFLTLAWALTSIGGAGGVLMDLSPFSQQVGPLIPLICSLVVMVFGVLAALGVALDRYWVEWASAWFVAGGIVAHSVFLWIFVFAGHWERLQNAALLSALLFFYAYRIATCAAHARKQRHIHEMVNSGEMGLPHA